MNISNGALNVTSFNNGPVSGMRNKLINGQFDVWQKTTSMTANPGYTTADRWIWNWDGGNGTKQVSRQFFAQGQTDVPYNPDYFMRIDQSGVIGTQTTFNRILQRIEGVHTLAGQTVTLTFWAMTPSTTFNINDITFLQVFGSGGSATTYTSLAFNIPITSTWQKYTYTINLPSVSGKTIFDDNYLQVNFNLPLTAAFTLYLANVQLEQGNVSSPYEVLPYNMSLNNCQRYYQCIQYPMMVGILSGSSNQFIAGRLACVLPTRLRAQPVTSLNGTMALWDGTAEYQANGYSYTSSDYTRSSVLELDIWVTATYGSPSNTNLGRTLSTTTGAYYDFGINAEL